MSNNAKIIIAVILVIGVIVLCCVNLGKDENKINNETNTQNLTVSNEVENTSTTSENVVTNNTVENEIVDDEPIIENVTEVKPQGTVYESNSDAGTTDKKQQAIGLVKDMWGEDDTVSFRCDSVSSNGEYIIAVVSKETASVKNYFRVNLTTKTVEVDY